MGDPQTVCCMCGDVGFPDKIFRCSKCRRRFQHSYCSNYYSEYAEPIEVCDWCQCEERKPSSSSSSSPKQLATNQFASNNNSKISHKYSASDQLVRSSSYSGDKIKQNDGEEGGAAAAREKATGKTPSPRTATRRYKLLKDVMC